MRRARGARPGDDDRGRGPGLPRSTRPAKSEGTARPRAVGSSREKTSSMSQSSCRGIRRARSRSHGPASVSLPALARPGPCAEVESRPGGPKEKKDPPFFLLTGAPRLRSATPAVAIAPRTSAFTPPRRRSGGTSTRSAAWSPARPRTGPTPTANASSAESSVPWRAPPPALVPTPPSPPYQ